MDPLDASLSSSSLPVLIDKMKENIRIEIAGNQDVAYGPAKGIQKLVSMGNQVL